MYGLLVRAFRILDRLYLFPIDEMYDLAIYAMYSKYLGLHWRDTKRILKSIFEAMDERSYKSIDEFRQYLTDEERRVFNAINIAESIRMRECVRFLAGEE